jgi:predicted transcriptional regulator
VRTIEVDAYVIDTLMGDVSLREIAEGTGLSRRGVQDAVARLAQRQLIGVERASITAVPRYRVHRPWARWMEAPAAT